MVTLKRDEILDRVELIKMFDAGTGVGRKIE
jgi:hypothetical protein